MWSSKAERSDGVFGEDASGHPAGQGEDALGCTGSNVAAFAVERESDDVPREQGSAEQGGEE